ncbi:MAG: hypothetical protein R3C32_12045 [Chloroflexota bacterium]
MAHTDPCPATPRDPRPPEGPSRPPNCSAVGAELVLGDTRDTNSGDIAHELTALGVEVGRVSDLPDRQEVVVAALASGACRPGRHDRRPRAHAGRPHARVHRAGVRGGALRGPDHRRMAAQRFERRGLPYVDANRKQAWLIPSATALPNPNGTAPGWWVDRPDGRVIAALPGSPREDAPDVARR